MCRSPQLSNWNSNASHLRARYMCNVLPDKRKSYMYVSPRRNTRDDCAAPGNCRSRVAYAYSAYTEDNIMGCVRRRRLTLDVFFPNRAGFTSLTRHACQTHISCYEDGGRAVDLAEARGSPPNAHCSVYGKTGPYIFWLAAWKHCLKS